MNRSRPALRLGPLIVGAFAMTALVGPALSPYAPEAIALEHAFELPSADHPLGTSDNGTDILSVLLHGARLAAVIALLSVGLSLAVGTTLGTIAGYFGGRTDHVVSAFADLVQAFPGILLAIGIMALTANPGITHVVVALSATGWVLFARIARAQTLTLRQMEFVLAARALGAGQLRILARHIAPNLWGPLVVQATSGLGMAILAESTLSFLGLGPGARASWGALLDQGSAVLLRFPHVALIAGSAISLTVLGFNLAGDWMRDLADARSVEANASN
ncbi:MAG: ABC transporter permease [Myxococcales bacterium]|nr:ABC transporter permease [Myxococcales bacterium]MDD9967144.1 ABC transporter permease [Myxococcales bacterium]